ncbi:MAG: redoxin domain-containing protein [Acidimicrobiia bacterium]
MVAEIGKPAPDFSLRDQNLQKVSLSDLAGRKSLIVFIPYPFTSVCQGELCAIRDDLGVFDGMDANVIAITCDTIAVNARWAVEQEYQFSILSDFWPHGEVAMAYGCFDDRRGYAKRYTYVLDADGVVRNIIFSDELGEARPHEAYAKALAAV